MTPTTPSPSFDTKPALSWSERAMLILGVIAFISSIMLWWVNNLSRTAYPQHIALTDNLQQARREINLALLFQAQYLAGEAVARQEIFSALDTAALKVKDCLDGRSTLQGIQAARVTGLVRHLLQSYAETLVRLDRTVRALLAAGEDRKRLQIRQLREFHELVQIADAIETEMAQALARLIARQHDQQRIGLGFWFLFLVSTFIMLYRAARIEAAQKQQEQLVHSLLESTTDAIFVKDHAGHYLLCNKAALQFIGKPEEELIGRDDRAAFPPEDAERLMAKDRSIMESGETIHYEERITSMQGQSLHFMISKGALRDRDGRVTGLFGIARDITRQRLDEEQLHRHRIILQRTSRLARVGGWEFDPLTRQLSWTEECARIHDLQPTDEISVDRWFAHIRGEHRRAIGKAFREALESGRSCDLELEIISAKGVHKWVRTQSEPVMEEGRVVYVYGALQDITDRKQAEAALCDSEMRRSLALDAVQMGTWEWDLTADRIACSETIEALWGYAPGTFPGTREAFTSRISPDDLPEIQRIAEEAKRARRPFRNEYRVIRPDGSLRWVASHGCHLFDDQDRAIRILGVAFDISEGKKTQKALRESEVRFRMLVEGAPEGIFVEAEGRFLFVNPAMVRLLGAAGAGDLVDAEVTEHIAPEYRQEVQGRIRSQCQKGGAPLLLAHEYLRLDGTRVPVETTSVAFSFHGRDGCLVFVRDITSRREAEVRQEGLRHQLEQAQKMESIGRLAGGVAHDFNNMLSIILGYGEIVLRELKPQDPLVEKVKEILDAGTRSAALTRQLLAFSRKQTLQPEIIDLNAVVRNLEKMLRRLIGEDVRLELSLARDLAPVMADPGQIEQVIMNLAVNARDAMPQGGRLSFETRNAELDDLFAATHHGTVAGKYVMLAVSDTGSGMEKEILGKIFEPFFTTKEKGKGTGLGLATVYGIVKQSGGSIWAYSEVGQGTSFKIYLPQVEARAQSKPDPLPGPGPAGGEHILVVEDEPSLRKLVGGMLTRMGYRVSVAANGDEALILVEKKGQVPDLLLTDVVMPGLSGAELAKRLRLVMPQLRVLYMSGYTNDAIVHHGVLDPGTPFIQKPMSAAALAEKVWKVLHNGG